MDESKMIKRCLIFFVIILSIAGLSCGSSQSGDADKVTRALALTVRTFINFFQDNLKNCDSFFEIYDGITEEVQPCDNPGEGTFQVTKLTVTCQNGPPLIANAVFTLEQNNCQDNGTKITSTGTMQMTLDFSAAGNFGTLATEDLFAEGLTFVFTDFVGNVCFKKSPSFVQTLLFPGREESKKSPHHLRGLVGLKIRKFY
jgi:hypothetical protein